MMLQLISKSNPDSVSPGLVCRDHMIASVHGRHNAPEFPATAPEGPDIQHHSDMLVFPPADLTSQL